MNNVPGLQARDLIKKRLKYRCFPVNIVKFFKKNFFIEHLWRLLLPLWRICKLWTTSILLGQLLLLSRICFLEIYFRKVTAFTYCRLSGRRQLLLLTDKFHQYLCQFASTFHFCSLSAYRKLWKVRSTTGACHCFFHRAV